MSNNSRSATNYDLTEFSYITHEQNYTGVYLNPHFLENISIGLLNEPESSGEAIDIRDTEVVHALDQLNPPEQNSEIIPGPVIDIDNLNQTPLSLNLESYEPVVESNDRNNTALRPITMDKSCNNSNNTSIRDEFCLPASVHNLVPGEQESGQFVGYKIVNANQSYSSTFTPSSRDHYSHNNNTSGVQEYDPYSSQIPSTSSYHCESNIKYCKPPQNKFDLSNTSTRDPRLMKQCGKYEYFERRSDDFEGLIPISYNNRDLNEELKIINMRLKNMNSSYNFSVVNDLRSVDNFNEDNIKHREEPRFENIQIDIEAESNIDRNNYLNNWSTEQSQAINVGETFGAIDLRYDNEDFIYNMECKRTSNVLEKYHKEKMKLGKSREDDQSNLTETAGNIIDNLNDDINDSRCTTKTLTKKKDVVIESHNLNDQTKNNIEKSNENLLTVENSKPDSIHKNFVNIRGLIEAYRNLKTLSGRSIEIIDLTNDDTGDTRVDKNVDNGMLTTELKDTKIMSMKNEDKSSKNEDKSSKNKKTLKKNKNKTNVENIILNEDRSVVDQHKTSEIKSYGYQSNKCGEFKGNFKHSESYTNRNSNEIDSKVLKNLSVFENITYPDLAALNSDQISNKQTNNANIWSKRIHFEDETDDDLINGPDGIYVLEPHNTNSINITELNEIKQKKIINTVETVYDESCVRVQSNPNTYTESAKSATNVGEKIKKLSIRVQVSKQTTDSNSIVKSPRYKNHRFPIDLNKFIQNNIGILHQNTNEDSLKSNTAQSLPNSDPRFKNVDNEQTVTYTSTNDATQSQTVVGRGYNSRLGVEKEVSYITFSEQVLNENSRSCDASGVNYNLNPIQMEQLFGDPIDEQGFTFDIDTDEIFEDNIQSPRDSFIGDSILGEESVDSLFINYILNEDSETRNTSELNKGLNMRSLDNQDTEISEFIEDDGQLPNVQSLADGDVLSAEKPPADVQNAEPEKIFHVYNNGYSPNLSPSAIDTSNSSKSDVEVDETNNLNTYNRITENELFSKWEDIKIQCDIVQSKTDGHLGPGKQIINNGECTDGDGTSYKLVDTSYSKKYFRKLKGMMMDHEQNKWLSDKMTTIADQVTLYKCPRKKCNVVFSRRKNFFFHMFVHCYIAKKDTESQEETCQFMICVYCFKSFGVNHEKEFIKHIFDNHSFSKYVCQYCLYRAYTASHVLIHQNIFHNKQKPSILELKDPKFRGTTKEILKVVDFNKFVLRYACNIGNCSFYSYMNSDFLCHLSQKHKSCDLFCCDFCDKSDNCGFLSFSPTSYIKHLKLHNINTYQCIFCLFGAEFINIMINHLAMEHFEYEPLCLERRPINNFCDDKKIENLKILNIKKCVPASIIKVVNSKSQIDFNTEENQINETRQADLTDNCTNTKAVNNQNTTQLSRRSTKTVICSSKNSLKPAIDNKNNMVISDESKINVPRGAQRNSKILASIGKDEKDSSQLSNYVITNLNFSSDEQMDQCKFNSNKNSDKIIPPGITYQDHLDYCPTETPIECTFCLSQSESTFCVFDLPKISTSNCFTCTFCDLKLPSSAIAKSHVIEVHNISSVEFVPVDIRATDIEKDRFLICEGKGLKRQKQANDSNFYSQVLQNNNLTSRKRLKVVNTHDDSQLTTIAITKNTLKQEIKRDTDESEQQQKTTKRKHSIESINNVTVVDNKKKPNGCRLYDTIPPAIIIKYFYPNEMDRIPQTPVFSNLIGCLQCVFYTKLRSNLVSHLNWHTVERYMLDLSNKTIPKDIQFKLKPEATASKPVNNSTCSSFEAEQNKKIITVENSVDDLILKSTIKLPSRQSRNDFPQFVPRYRLFKCPLNCNYISKNMKTLKYHILYEHRNFYYYTCPHCRPSNVTFNYLQDLESHFHFHGTDLYICLYCNYIHYNRSNVELHQKIIHQSRISDDKFNIDTIRSQNPDQPTVEWKCNICMSSIKFTIAQIAAHLLIVHKISIIFKCLICEDKYNNYEAFEQHFKFKHPSMELKYLNEHVDIISPDAELRSNVDKHASSNENHLLYVLEALDGITEPALHTLQETPILKSLDVSEHQGKIFDKLSGELSELKYFLSMMNCTCPVCIVFLEKGQGSSQELVQKINCSMWKCLECFLFSHPVKTMEINAIKDKELKQKFEKIKTSQKKCLVDGIIEFQNILIHELLKINYPNTNSAEQHGTETISSKRTFQML